jgi:hypothetical protein
MEPCGANILLPAAGGTYRWVLNFDTVSPRFRQTTSVPFVVPAPHELGVALSFVANRTPSGDLVAQATAVNRGPHDWEVPSVCAPYGPAWMASLTVATRTYEPQTIPNANITCANETVAFPPGAALRQTFRWPGGGAVVDSAEAGGESWGAEVTLFYGGQEFPRMFNATDEQLTTP